MSETGTAPRQRATCPGRGLLPRLAGLALAVLLVLTSNGTAQETPSPGSEARDWNFEARLYGWLPEISSTTITGQEVTIDLDDILDTLAFTFQGGFTAQRGP